MDRNRYSAVTILHRILVRGVKPKEAMREGALPDTAETDLGFIMEIVYGCVRYKLYLEWILDHFLRRDSRVGEFTRINLMAGMYQLAIMRTPDWAAVNETVEIEKKRGGIPGLVNGVLRNYLRTKDSLALPPLSSDPVAHISIATSHPAWMIRRWVERLPIDEVFSLARANNEVPPLSLRINTLAASPEETMKKLRDEDIPFVRSRYAPDGILLKQVPFRALAALRGAVYVQDEASQLVSYLLQPHSGRRILDACAAPGGKATHIAQLTRNRARILALDADEERLALLRENIAHLGATSVSPVRGDILTYEDTEPFDRILLDAPCSSLGVIRRNPDVKYRHAPETIAEAGRKQLAMLNHAARLLRPSGLLVYSVCSTEPEETTDVIRGFLNINREFDIIKDASDMEMADPFRNRVEEMLRGDGYMITYPHVHGTDGFFAVRLGKK